MFNKTLLRFWRDERGATAIEYGLIAALIAVGLIAAMTLLGGNVTALYGTPDTGAAGAMAKANAKF